MPAAKCKGVRPLALAALTMLAGARPISRRKHCVADIRSFFQAALNCHVTKCSKVYTCKCKTNLASAVTTPILTMVACDNATEPGVNSRRFPHPTCKDVLHAHV